MPEHADDHGEQETDQTHSDEMAEPGQAPLRGRAIQSESPEHPGRDDERRGDGRSGVREENE